MKEALEIYLLMLFKLTPFEKDYDETTVSGITFNEFLNLYTERLSDTYDPNEPLWSALAYDGIWALALCLNKSIPSNALQGYSVGDYHNTKLIQECFSTLNFNGVSGAIRVSSERAFVDRIIDIHQVINRKLPYVAYCGL